MGLAKVSLMSLFIAMAANLRLTDTFAARQAKKEADAVAAAAAAPPSPRQLADGDRGAAPPGA